MLGKLVPCGGGPPIPLLRTTLVIGRQIDCDLVVPCKTVSGRHCELRFEQDGWNVRDLDSKNGITVNGVRCAANALAPDDILAVGKQRYVVTYQRREAKPSTPAALKNVEDLALELLTADEPSPPSPLPSATPAPAKAILGKLVPCGGGDATPLLLPELTVGRHPGCDICVPNASVSARHCKLLWQEGYWFVHDLDSRNGTWVNGARCRRKCLVPQCVLGLAKHRFTIHYTPAAAGPPPEEEDIFSQSLMERLALVKDLGDPS